jgi:UDP-N-acetylmuramate: L-alanyl-gamma-D-glutamyl-meso-diaminopimelate ligase
LLKDTLAMGCWTPLEGFARGPRPGALWSARALAGAADFSRFEVLEDGRAVGAVQWPLIGAHNMENALAAIAAARHAGVEVPRALEALQGFTGIARRMQLRGEVNGIRVYDDFAHHPTAIAATLAALADRYPDRRILAAFEPRSNTSRRNVFQSEFARAFDHAARVYLAPVYFKENDQIPSGERLATDTLASEITRRGPIAAAYSTNQQLLEALIANAKEGDVIAVMSNGPFDNLKNRLLEQLQQKAS